MKICICAIAKMEELYIREWIEWHKQLGVDHIFIGDNNDSDYDKPLCPIIQDYIDSGFVEVVNINDELDPQLLFYNQIYLSKKNEYNWFGFIDIDEFIELPAYNNDIHLFLSDNKFKDIDSIIFPWLYYGDDDHLYYEDKPVKERFKNPKYCLDDTNEHKVAGIKFFIKSINNMFRLESIHYPLNCRLYNDKNDKNEKKYIYGGISCCDSLGRNDYIIVKNNITTAVKGFDKLETIFWPTNIIVDLETIYWPTDIIVDNKNYYNEAYISHYITKSTEEYIKYKMLRGRPDQQYGIRYTDGFYFVLNKSSKEKQQLFDKYSIDIINKRNIFIEKYKNYEL